MFSKLLTFSFGTFTGSDRDRKLGSEMSRGIAPCSLSDGNTRGTKFVGGVCELPLGLIFAITTRGGTSKLMVCVLAEILPQLPHLLGNASA
jgi:hypothetical protein